MKTELLIFACLATALVSSCVPAPDHDTGFFRPVPASRQSDKLNYLTMENPEWWDEENGSPLDRSSDNRSVEQMHRENLEAMGYPTP